MTYGQFHGAPGSPAHPMDLDLLVSKEPVFWNGKQKIPGLSTGFKIRVSFEGERQNIRIYALYVAG